MGLGESIIPFKMRTQPVSEPVTTLPMGKEVELVRALACRCGGCRDRANQMSQGVPVPQQARAGAEESFRLIVSVYKDIKQLNSTKNTPKYD